MEHTRFQLWIDGYGPTNLAARMNVARSTVHRWKHGMTPKGQHCAKILKLAKGALTMADIARSSND